MMYAGYAGHLYFRETAETQLHQAAGPTYLCLQDCKPELLSLDHTLGTALSLKLLVQGIKGFPPALGQPGGLVGAEEGPLCVCLHSPHEQVIHPQPIEQIPCPHL